MNLAAIPRIRERVASRVVEGRALVVVLDAREIHRLNPVGARIWQLCDGRSLAEIRDAVVSEFQVGATTAEQDVVAFVEQLSAVGAVELTSP